MIFFIKKINAQKGDHTQVGSIKAFSGGDHQHCNVPTRCLGKCRIVMKEGQRAQVVVYILCMKNLCSISMSQTYIVFL